MALGVALGSGFSDMHYTTEQMCVMHRPKWAIAMLRVVTMLGQPTPGGAHV